MLVRFYTLHLLLLSVLLASSSAIAFDNLPTDQEVEQLGLVVHWRSTARDPESALANRALSFGHIPEIASKSSRFGLAIELLSRSMQISVGGIGG